MSMWDYSNLDFRNSNCGTFWQVVQTFYIQENCWNLQEIIEDIHHTLMLVNIEML